MRHHMTIFSLILVALFILAQATHYALSKSVEGKVGIADLFNLRNLVNDPIERQKRREAAKPGCGYPSCPKVDANKLNVHIIAHSHDDVGWLKTVDQYYYGTKKSYSQASVQFILDTVIQQLVMDKDKRFIYVEMSFFTKWWAEQSDTIKEVVIRLVNEGRLEFINGGWCMNDEATVNYHSTIEQMTLGLKFLNETFGECGHPKVGWQIDPFGHSSEQASLFAQFGFDGMYFVRINYEDKEDRIQSKSLDIIWHGDRALPHQSGSIFTNIFYNHYSSPEGYCFDALCNDDLIVDNKKSYEYNVESMGNKLIQYIRRFALSKLTNQLLIPFGGDFEYTAAGQNFHSIDKLIKYIREKAPDINIFYSTPSCYQYAIHSRLADMKNISLPEKYDDFMPYESSHTIWWSGYFTSRPSVKLIERETADLLQVSRLVSLASLIDLATSAKTSSSSNKNKSKTREAQNHEELCLTQLWEVLGDLQHHDAVSGTEKQHVANDYVRRASDAARRCAKFLGSQKRRRMSSLLDKTNANYHSLITGGYKYNLESIYLEETSFCQLNISQCEPLEMPIDNCYHSKLLSEQLDQPQTASTCSKSSSMHRLQASSKRPTTQLMKELERKGALITVYNPLASPIKQTDIRLPCIGQCDLDKIQVILVSTNETVKLARLPLPAGISSLSSRESLTKHEILFYIDLPPLGSASLVMSDSNEVDLLDEEQEYHQRAKRSFEDESLTTTYDDSECEVCETSRITSSRKSGHPIDLITIPVGFDSSQLDKDEQISPSRTFSKRDTEKSDSGEGIGTDRVIVKFDMLAGIIVGLKRVSDGSFLNVTQKFGTYRPSPKRPSGAYIFRVDSMRPELMQRPISFKIVKRFNGSLIEIHQKWADWIYQTIKVDAKKNYIEFDYVVGPVPTQQNGTEVITRYITNLQNEGIFFTDSNGRQMMPRTKLDDQIPANLGGSFFPVVSTMMIKQAKVNTTKSRNAEAVAILVDRSQAGTSLEDGNLEFLIHRRLLNDDSFGVDEPLNEPGDDGHGLVSRGKHRVYLKFPSIKNDGEQQQQPEVRQLLDSSGTDQSAPKVFKLPRTPRLNMTYELGKSAFRARRGNMQALDEDRLNDVYLIHDQSLNDLRQESVKYALRPVLTFERLRTSAREYMQILTDSQRADFSLLNTTLPKNIHLLTLQTWNRKPNELLIRLENLDNPLVLSSFPNREVFSKTLLAYKTMASLFTNYENLDENNRFRDDACRIDQARAKTHFDIEYLINKIRITSIEEYNLGANVELSEDKRLDWTHESIEQPGETCNNTEDKPTTVSLGPREIRTFLATYEFIQVGDQSRKVKVESPLDSKLS